MLRIVYSFPWEIGASGIGYTAWCQVEELNNTGVEINLLTGNVKKKFTRPLHKSIQTMSVGSRKIPAKLFGGMDRAAAYHDFRTARFIELHHKSIDALHCWPTASEKSIKAAKKHNIATFLERPNAHTEFAYDIVEKIYQELKLQQNKNASHTKNHSRLQKEEKEYQLTDHLLCPSDFVLSTFKARGYKEPKLVRHRYGFSPDRIQLARKPSTKFSLIFIGNDAPRKGLHNILKAWRESKASSGGEFHIFGKIDNSYLAHIADLINCPGVTYHGFSSEVGRYLNSADCFVLSSYEEGSALVTYEARAAGCVLLVSDATGAVVKHGYNGLVHCAGDVKALTAHIDQLFNNRDELENLRQHSIDEIDTLTWAASAELLASLYSTYQKASS